MAQKKEKDRIIKQTTEKYNILDHKKRRERLHRPKLRSNRTNVFNNFPPEIFTDSWNKFKSVFGHLRRDIDPDDPISK
jgi:hypothetical protein